MLRLICHRLSSNLVSLIVDCQSNSILTLINFWSPLGLNPTELIEIWWWYDRIIIKEFQGHFFSSKYNKTKNLWGLLIRVRSIGSLLRVIYRLSWMYATPFSPKASTDDLGNMIPWPMSYRSWVEELRYTTTWRSLFTENSFRLTEYFVFNNMN